MRSIHDLKKLAREAMRGNTGWLILAMAAYYALGFAGSILTDTFFPASGMVNLVIGQVFYFILTLVFGIFYGGVRLLYLNGARDRICSMDNLFYFFKNNPDRVIVASFVVTLIGLVVSIPLNIFSYTADVGQTVEAQLQWAMQSLLWMAVATIAAELLTLPFEMVYFLLADHPGMSGIEALKGSVRMLKGRIGKLLLLKLSFIPAMFLSVFTLYLALLWIVPYMEMTIAVFYRDLQGEYDMEADHRITMQENRGLWELPGNDDHSEA